jgi:hypothetical protein
MDKKSKRKVVLMNLEHNFCINKGPAPSASLLIITARANN